MQEPFHKKLTLEQEAWAHGVAAWMLLSDSVDICALQRKIYELSGTAFPIKFQTRVPERKRMQCKLVVARLLLLLDPNTLIHVILSSCFEEKDESVRVERLQQFRDTQAFKSLHHILELFPLVDERTRRRIALSYMAVEFYNIYLHGLQVEPEMQLFAQEVEQYFAELTSTGAVELKHYFHPLLRYVTLYVFCHRQVELQFPPTINYNDAID